MLYTGNTLQICTALLIWYKRDFLILSDWEKILRATDFPLGTEEIDFSVSMKTKNGSQRW